MSKTKPSIPSSTKLLDRWATARDCWPGGTLAFWNGEELPLPSQVFWPENDRQVESVFELARSQHRAVITYGAGSGVCGGARGTEDAFVIDTKRLQAIGPLDVEQLTVEVEAGVNGQHLEDWLQERGFTLGHSPSSIWCSTVGGWAAARGAGQFSSYYGVFEDMVLGLSGVSPGYGSFSIGLNGTGPQEWMPMLLGSEGTLGVLTRLTLRVAPLPQERWLRGYHFDTIEDAVDAMRDVMQAEVWPSVLRLYDPVDTRIGGKTKQKRKEGGNTSWLQNWFKSVAELPAIRARTLSLPLAYPKYVNNLLDRFSDGCLLIVGFEGHPDIVQTCAEVAKALLDAKGRDLGEEPGWRWFHSRHAVSYKLMPIFERGGFADTMEVACRWSQVVPLYNAVRAAVRDHVIVMAHMSHAYTEGGSIYFSFAGKGDQAVYTAVWSRALEAVEQVGATVTHHHGVGTLKAISASREIGPAIQGWKEAKSLHDPHGLLNPGRVFIEGDYPEVKRSPELGKMDGLIRIPLNRSADEMKRIASDQNLEIRWLWETIPAPPRWYRTRWQIPWTEVEGTLDGRRVHLGKGPRSAAGSDLRTWLVEQTPTTLTVTVPAVSMGTRWYAECECPTPWKRAHQILRRGFRPAVCTVVGEKLVVGFRGPAASRLGTLVAKLFELSFVSSAWKQWPLPAGDLQLERTPTDRTVGVTLEGFLVRREAK